MNRFELMNRLEKGKQFISRYWTRLREKMTPAVRRAAEKWHKLMDFQGRKRALYSQWNQAAEQGSREAAYKLLMLYFDEGEEYYPLAYKWTEYLAREGNDCGVLLQLAQMYEKGHGVAQDKQKALTWYERCLSLHIIKGKDSSLSLETTNFVQERIQALRGEQQK
jgi:hypothetical protein